MFSYNTLFIFFIFLCITFLKMNYKLLVNYYWFVINIIWHTCYFLRQLLMFIISAERLNCQSSLVHHTHVNNALRAFEYRSSQHQRIIRKHEHLLVSTISRVFSRRKMYKIFFMLPEVFSRYIEWMIECYLFHKTIYIIILIHIKYIVYR